MNELKLKRQVLKQQNAKFGPTLREVPRNEWSAESRAHAHQPLRIWQSKNFAAHLWDDNGHQRLTVCRTAIKSDGHWQDGITWDELQRIKSEAGFGDRWAVEIYPPDSGVVNVANMRHLWLIDEAPAFAWTPCALPMQGW